MMWGYILFWWGRLGRHLKGILDHIGVSWSILGSLGAILGGYWELFWGILGVSSDFWGASWDDVGGSSFLLVHFVAILGSSWGKPLLCSANLRALLRHPNVTFYLNYFFYLVPKDT